MKISVIAAMATDGLIGKDNSLPWRLPEDLKRFKDLTWGKTLIMGRKTFESIGNPLKNRKIIVVTHQMDYPTGGVEIAHSLEEAIDLCRSEEVFIAGGSQIYKQTLELADQLYLTIIDKRFNGNVFFPEWDETLWELREKQDKYDPQGFGYKFLVYSKKNVPYLTSSH